MSEEMQETQVSQPETPEKSSFENTIYDWAKSLIAAVVAVILMFTFLVRLIGVNGPSMQDTLYTGDRLVVLNSMFCDYKPGDVVVVNAYNAQLNETIVKRIIAVGGQIVDVDFFTGTVYVDGVPLDEPYAKEPTFTSDGTRFPLLLQEDEVFLMGDNRNHSTDSRSVLLGAVKEDYIQGKAVFLLFPGQTPSLGKREWGRIGLIR